MIDAIVERLPRVLRVEGPVHGEIAADQSATGQAILVTAVAAAISSLTGGEGNFIVNVVGAFILAPIGLFIWTGITFVLGKMFGGTASYIELARPIGYSGAPYALGIIPGIGGLAGAIFQVKAHQEVNGLSQGAAIAVVVIPLAVLLVLSFVLALVAGLALLSAFGGAAGS